MVCNNASQWFCSNLELLEMIQIALSVLHEWHMNTQFALFARFESPTVELKQVSQEFFGITPRTAEMRAKVNDFPVPTFKLRDSERSPTLIMVKDLATYIDKRYQSARADWEHIHE